MGSANRRYVPLIGPDEVPPVQLDITALGPVVQEALRAGGDGEVLVALERCFYLRLGGEVICIANPELGDGPLTARLHRSAASPWSELIRFNSAQWSATPSRIEGPGFVFDVAGATPWQPAIRSGILGCEQRLVATQILRRIIRSAGREEGLAGLALGVPGQSTAPEAMVRAVSGFRRWLSEDCSASDGHRSTAGTAQEPAASDGPAALLGLGPGLTPSGDDVLVGALIGADAVGRAGLQQRLRTIVSVEARYRTSPISAAFLYAACRGLAGEALMAVAAALNGSPRALTAAALSAVRVGQSSGAEALAGIVMVLEHAGRHRVRESSP